MSSPPKLQKYTHLSEINKSFLAIQKDVDTTMAQMWELPLEKIREVLLEAQLPVDIPKDLDITHQLIPMRDGVEREVRVYRREKEGKDKVLVFFVHGGGWVVGGHGMEEISNRFVTKRAGAVVVSVDYRMAPEFRYPYAVNDCYDALKWCKSNAAKLGANPEKIILGGSSAGGNLAAVLAHKAHDDNITGIIGQVLNIPVTCHPKFFPREKYEYSSFEQNKDASLLDSERMMWFWDLYVTDLKPERDHSPLLAKSFKGLPPALIQIAGLDPLRDEGLAYAEALKEAGVPVQLEIYPGLPHGFGSLIPLTSYVSEYTDKVVDWVVKTSKGSGDGARL